VANRWSPQGISRWVGLTHAATLVAAFAVLAWLDRHLWFFADDWDFVLKRGLFHAQWSIWYPHNEHWSTLPILAWRAIYCVFGLTTYWPYLLLALAGHIVLVHLIWRRCINEGADPWVATAVTALFAFLGAGAENLAWAFQIGFIGSVLFGYLALALADRPRPSAAADLGAAAAALAALMCSTIGDSATLALGVAVACRRGRRAALRVVALPVACYVLWFGLVGRQGLAANGDNITTATLTGLPTYVWGELSSSLGRVFNFGPAGPALLLGLLAWVAWHGRDLRERHPAVLGLTGAAVVFFILVGLGRERFGASMPTSRYVYVLAAFLLPTMALVAGSGRAIFAGARPIVLATVTFVLLGNIGQLTSYVWGHERGVIANEHQTLTSAELLAAGMPSLVQNPVPYSPKLTVAVLAGLSRSGRLPAVPISSLEVINDETHLQVALLALPLPGRFTVIGIARATEVRTGPGCLSFVPPPAGPSGQVTLGMSGSATSALVITVPGAGLTGYLKPRSGPGADEGVRLTMRPSGRAYLADIAPGDRLDLVLPYGDPTQLCDLAPARSAHHSGRSRSRE
jgi:hypothetical protein